MYIEFSLPKLCVLQEGQRKKIYTFEKPGPSLLLLAKSFQPSCPETLSEKMPGLKKRLEKISGMIPNFLNLLFPSRIFQETGDLTQYVLRVGNTMGDAILGRKNE